MSTGIQAAIGILVSASIVSGCAGSEKPSRRPDDTVAIAVLPDQSEPSLLSRYDPLVSYLESSTGIALELTVPASYQDLVDRFDDGDIQIANFGGLTFIQAERRSRARPLVMRDVDLRFTSCFLVRASDERSRLKQFDGEAFSFGPRLSTSGHLMPRYFLSRDGIVPELYFATVLHSSGHDQTAEWVSDGIVPIGVANCDIARSMMSDGRLGEPGIRVLDTTPPYPDYVWAVQDSLDTALINKLRDAFLALDPTKPEHLSILQTQGANGYLPAGSDDFKEVRLAAEEAGLLNGATSR